MNNELKDIGRKTTMQEYKYIKGSAILWLILGAVATFISVILIILAEKEYAYDGNNIENARGKLNLVFVALICILSISGISYLHMGIKLFFNIKNIMVMQVEITRTYMEPFSLFFTGEYKYMLNDRKKTKFANVAYGAEKIIKNDRRAILYYIPEKFYILGKCIENTDV